MSDKDKPELKALEPILDETVITDSPIKNPTDQNTWSTTQQGHVLKEGDSATHIGLPPGELEHLQAHGLAEKFEIVDSSKEKKGPLEDFKKEGTLSDTFIKQMREGIQQIPVNERNFLEKAGVKIVAKDVVDGHAGSPAVYMPGDKTVNVGMTGSGEGGDKPTEANAVTWKIRMLNKDVQGTLKHELGHALYDNLKLDQLQELRAVIAEERAKVRDDDKHALEHLLEDDSEIFAESYAFIRKRDTPRVTALMMNFPRTIALVDDILRTNKELNPE